MTRPSATPRKTETDERPPCRGQHWGCVDCFVTLELAAIDRADKLRARRKKGE